MRLFWPVFVFGLFPTICLGSVSISEVAWMGSEESANHEWIELYNSGNTAEVLDGWVLKDADSLLIELSGTIQAGEYVLLERNRSDGQYQSGSPLVVYTGALVNTGTTLTLLDSNGSVVDNVVGGSDWENIGGDNVTKSTAQYNGSIWITAPRTPNTQNAKVGDIETETNESKETNNNTQSPNSSSKSKKATSVKKTVAIEVKNPELSLVLDVPDIVYVNQVITMKVEPKGLSKTLRDSLQYNWNFGDLNSRSGKVTEHSYEFPGDYVVSVRGSYATKEEVLRKTITVLPVTLSLTRNSYGDVQVNNDSPYEVILDNYTLEGLKEVVFPDRTVILPKSTITVPLSKLGGNIYTPVALKDGHSNIILTNIVGPNEPYSVQNNQLVTIGSITKTNTAKPNIMAEIGEVETENQEDIYKFNFINKAEAEELDKIITSDDINPESEISVVTTSTSSSLLGNVVTATKADHDYSRSSLPDRAFVGLFLILLVGVGAVFWSHPQKSA
ncbi:lamin tail domain-containing protein [Candidatus Kaiserbacteria bacterium]|nr:lamin tail domain-containing protein [Candidatus Kaiserbacteria bacterium]